jgi:glutathione synthase/RimK-type ligase-like ATP-grasp enzyme
MEPILDKRDIPWCRLHLGEFPIHVSAGYEIERNKVSGVLRIRGEAINLTEIQSVWYRRTEKFRFPAWLDDADRNLAQRESEAFIQGLWRMLSSAVWVSSPDAIRGASSKAEQLLRAPKYGFCVPRTCVSNDPAFVREFVYQVGEKNEVIYKPHTPIFVDQPGGKKGVVYTTRLNQAALGRLDEIHLAPGIFQVYVRKSFELRVTVVGDSVFACAIDSQAMVETETDWRAHLWGDSRTFPPHSTFDLPQPVADSCRRFVKSYGLMFGAIDLIVDPDGEYYFLELNPNGQWVWVQQATGLPIGENLCQVFIGR